MDVDQTFAFDAVVLGDRFRHVYMFPNEPKILVDRFRKRVVPQCGSRSSRYSISPAYS